MPLTVTFKPNGASGAMSPITGKDYGSSFSLTENAFAKEGYSFNGWTNDLARTFTDGASVKGSDFWDDATGRFHAALFARWRANTYTVTFDGNGGSTPVSYTITYTGVKLGATNPNPTTYTIETTPITFVSPGPVTGFTFSNWSQASIEKGSTGNKTVTASYLTWIEKPTPAKYELTYNGGLQTIASGSNMSATGNQASGSVRKATEVGTYYVKATPNANYAWSDDKTETRDFAWRIVEGHYTATVSAGEGGRGGWTREYATSNDPQAFTVTLPTRTGYQITQWTASGYVGDAPTVSGTTLTIPTVSGTDYGVWTNADLMIDSWGLMGEPQKGDGNPWKVEWTVIPEFPQLFFRAHKVEYK